MIILRVVYEGGILQEQFLDEESALVEAASRIKNNCGVPIAIHTVEGEVLYNYTDIRKKLL